jgi:hypothetical protein
MPGGERLTGEVDQGLGGVNHMASRADVHDEEPSEGSHEFK